MHAWELIGLLLCETLIGWNNPRKPTMFWTRRESAVRGGVWSPWELQERHNIDRTTETQHLVSRSSPHEDLPVYWDKLVILSSHYQEIDILFCECSLVNVIIFVNCIKHHCFVHTTQTVSVTVWWAGMSNHWCYWANSKPDSSIHHLHQWQFKLVDIKCSVYSRDEWFMFVWLCCLSFHKNSPNNIQIWSVDSIDALKTSFTM